MCGICGKISTNGQPVDAELLRRMCSRLTHRGPDNEGVYNDPVAGLGHRRLSITDLTPEAAQPIFNEDRSLVLVVNGEIYNYKELRSTLEQQHHTFVTQTDSEVIVHLYEELGHKCVDKLEGMFSFVIWDSRKKELFAARDRTGQKPFFYAQHDNGFSFASELHALLADPDVPREVNRRAVFDFLSFYYIPAPQTGFAKVHKLPPGHVLVFADGKTTITPYWSLSYAKLPFIGDESEVAHRVRDLIDRSVKQRLQADVPVGLFLSGGIDSSIIACSAAAAQQDVTAYSVRLSDARYDESGQAAEFAQHLGLKHEIVDIEADVPALLEDLAVKYGEPFADSSCIPTYSISKAAASNVKVILSGDGGDEIFAGYNRYRAYKYQSLLSIVPHFMLKPLLTMGSFLGKSAQRNSLREYIGRFCGTLRNRGLSYSAWIFLLTQGEKLAFMEPEFLEQVNDIELPSEAFISHIMASSKCGDISERAMAADFLTYLPGDLLTKVDIASMAHGLEVRCPFLDHRLVEYTASLPFAYKLYNGTHKYILKQAFRNALPKAVRNRGKRGFSVPLENYLNGPLKPMIKDKLLGASSFVREVFRPEAITIILEREQWSRAEAPLMFGMLMLEPWHDKVVKASSV